MLSLLMGDKHVLKIAGRFEKIKKACEFVVDGAQQCGMDEAAIFHVELACDEACTNIIEHAYGEDVEGQIEVSWQVDDDLFKIIIHDNGRSFDPANVPKPTTGLSSPSEAITELRVGGLGIHFMRKLMDEVHFDFDQEKGNTLIMVKKMPKEQEK